MFEQRRHKTVEERKYMRFELMGSSNRDSTLQRIFVKFTLNLVRQTRSVISVHYNW